MIGKSLAALAGLSLAAAPALAQPSARSLSLQGAAGVTRAAAPTTRKSELAGGSWIPIILALAIVTGGVLLAAGVFDDDNGTPTSP
jgi:hypothetical protein